MDFMSALCSFVYLVKNIKMDSPIDFNDVYFTIKQFMKDKYPTIEIQWRSC